MDSKALYGEVNSPSSLVKIMINLIPDRMWEKTDLKAIDVGCGNGAFSTELSVLFDDKNLTPVMDYLDAIEIQANNVEHCRKDSCNKASIVHNDFLTWKAPYLYDLVIGNPPFNFNGLKVVPTNSNKQRCRSITIWPSFVKKSLSILKNDGLLLLITPSIWMKPDAAGIYDLLTTSGCLKIRCLCASQTTKLFQGKAQTPTSIFLLEKGKSSTLSLYDETESKYVRYTRPSPYGAIPVKHIGLINQLQHLIRKHGRMEVIKTSNSKSLLGISDKKTSSHIYKNIKTALLCDRDVKLVTEWSDKENIYHGKMKLVLPHKMYGMPYIDRNGEFGIARRDIYVILNEDIEYLESCRYVLASDLAIKIFEAAKYRMRFLEKYAFEFIPKPCPELLEMIRQAKQTHRYTFNYLP